MKLSRSGRHVIRFMQGLIAFALLVGRSSALGPSPAIVWNTSYNGASSGNDLVGRLAVDSAGNAVIGGHYTTGGAFDWMIRKLDTAGTTLWVQTWGTGGVDELYSIAVDGADNVIASGTYSTFDWEIRKYDSAGTLQWSRLYGTAGDDRPYGIAADAAGNISVAGYENGGTLRVIRYDAAGTTLWSQTFGSGIPYDAAADNAGNTYVAATQNVGGQWDAYVLKIDGTGALVWSRIWDRGASSNDQAWGVAVDDSGNVYASGQAGSDWMLEKYDAAGATLWRDIYNSPGNSAELAEGVRLDPAGCPMAFAYEDRPDLGQNWNFLIRKYDAWGNLKWTFTWNGAANNQDFARGAGIDSHGDIFIAGIEQTATQGQDWRMMKLHPAAELAVSQAQTPAAPGLGAPVAWRIVATNTGASTLTTVTLTDTLPAVVVGVMTDQPAGFGAPVVTTVPGTGTRFVWSASGLTLAPRQTYTFTITGFLGVACAPTAVSATPAGTGTDGVTTALAVGNPTGFMVQPHAVGMNVVLSQSPASPVTGNPVTYRIVATNTGTATLTGLSVTDTISALLAGAAWDQPAGFGVPVITGGVSATRFVWSNAGFQVLPGQSCTFTITGTVGATCATTTVSNTAYVVASSPCLPQVAALTGPVGFMLVSPTVSIASSLQQTNPTGIGSPMTYRIIIQNTGTATMSSLVVTDTVSGSLVNATSSEPAGFPAPLVASVASGTNFFWSSTALSFAPGAVWTFTVTGLMGSVCGNASVSSTAFVAGGTSCVQFGAYTNAVGFMQAGPATGIVVAATHVPPIPVNLGPADYSIVITNTGASTLTSLTVSDTLPNGVSLVGEASGGLLTHTNPAGSLQVWTGAVTLTPGASLTVSLYTTAGCGGGTVTNTVVVTGVSACTTGSAATSDVFTLPGAAPAVSVTATRSPAQPVAGGTVRYILVATNSGATPLVDVLVTDTLPAGFILASQTATGGLAWHGATGTPSWSGTVNLAPGASVTITVDASIPAGFSGDAKNAAWVLGTVPCGAAEHAASQTFSIAAPEPDLKDAVKIVGGIRGYLDPRKGEQATILVRPEGAGEITARIYNLNGELVRTLSTAAAGGHTEVLRWDATDATGRPVPPGAYPILIEGPGIRFRDTLAVLR